MLSIDHCDWTHCTCHDIRIVVIYDAYQLRFCERHAITWAASK
jgi:hypothetical protein